MTRYSSVKDFVEDFSNGIVTSSNVPSATYSPFKVNANEYFSFAVKDIARGHDTHNLLNAIGNVKRSMDCRIDAILHFWGLYDFAKKKNLSFQQRLDIIARMGIVAPSILRKINTYRNKAEHDYTSPSVDSVQDFCDIAQLFLSYTDKHLRDLIIDEVERDADDDDGGWLRLVFDRDVPEFVIEIKSPVMMYGKRVVVKEKLQVSLHKDVDDYLKVVRWWYTLDR